MYTQSPIVIFFYSWWSSECRHFSPLYDLKHKPIPTAFDCISWRGIKPLFYCYQSILIPLKTQTFFKGKWCGFPKWIQWTVKIWIKDSLGWNNNWSYRQSKIKRSCYILRGYTKFSILIHHFRRSHHKQYNPFIPRGRQRYSLIWESGYDFTDS